jgi:AraC-like DNA-binding protein
MDVFLENLVRFTHGMTLAFFIMMSVRLYQLKKNNRLFIFLFWESVFWMLIQLKDVVYLFDDIARREHLSDIQISIDTWCVPATMFLLMEITQPRRLTLIKMTLMMLPSVLLTTGLIITKLEILLHILLVYSLIVGLFMATTVFMASSKHDNYIKRNFSYTDNISVAWVKRVILLLFTMLVVWMLILLQTRWTGDSIFYLFQIVVWSYIYVYSMKHIVVDVPLQKNHNLFFPELEEVDETREETESIENSLFESKLEQFIKEKRLYLNPTLTISEIATAMGTNRTYLSEYLNKTMGTTFIEYVNRFRVNEACEILTKGNYFKMEEVAEQSGFNSLSTFHRTFLKVAKMTPLQYRNRIAK